MKLTCFAVLLVLVRCDSDSNSINGTENDRTVTPEPPYSVVSLKEPRYFRPGQYHHFCTGSILNKDWVLTAGHCFSNRFKSDVSDLVVDVGSIYVTNGTRYKISDFFVHPNESESIQIYRNDLCLLKMETPIAFSSLVQPVRLGTIKDQLEVPVLAGGWGTTSDHGAVRTKLRYVKLKTLKHDKCQKIHDKKKNLVDTVTHICGYWGLGTTLCFGDSGSPMFDERGHQVAVFSALENCSGEYPVLFMKIEVFMGWIKEVTGVDFRLD